MIINNLICPALSEKSSIVVAKIGKHATTRVILSVLHVSMSMDGGGRPSSATMDNDHMPRTGAQTECGG